MNQQKAIAASYKRKRKSVPSKSSSKRARETKEEEEEEKGLVLTGFKLTGADGKSFNGKVHYEANKQYELPNNQKPKLCIRGYHFCFSAVECLLYRKKLQRPLRLWAVEAPADRVVIGGSHKCVSSKLTIKKEITDHALKDSLLTGTVWSKKGRGRYRAGKRVSFRPRRGHCI